MNHRLLRALVVTATGAVLAIPLAALADPALSLRFEPDTVSVEAVSRLHFTVETDAPVADVAFSLELSLGVLVAPAPAATSDCLARIDATAGSTRIEVAIDRLGPSGCEVSVDVVPTVAGSFPMTTSAISSASGPSEPASATLTSDAAAPQVAKTFTPATVPLGGTARMAVTFSNLSQSDRARDIEFTDVLPAELRIASPPRVSDGCNDALGATLTVDAAAGRIDYSGGSVAGFDQCSVEVDVVAESTGVIASTTWVARWSGGPLGRAGATLTVTPPGNPSVRLEVLDDPGAPGGEVSLVATIQNLDRENALTDVATTIDLNAALTGLRRTGPAPSAPCGAGSAIAGDGVVTLTGGSLAPGESCLVSIPLAVPATATDGAYVITTGPITGTAGGREQTSGPVSTTLVVSGGPVATLSFADEVSGAGGATSLTVTLTNPNATFEANGIDLTVEFLDFPETTRITSEAGTACGGGTLFAISDDETLTTARLVGASLEPASSCTFDLAVTLPESITGGAHSVYVTSLSAVVDARSVRGTAGQATLTVVAGPTLSLALEESVVSPGDDTTLIVEIWRPAEETHDIAQIGFSLDLEAALTGLTTAGLPLDDLCGPDSSLDDEGVLRFRGGALAAGDRCLFEVPLTVPGSAPVGTYTLESSPVSASWLDLPLGAPGASTRLTIRGLTITAAFPEEPVAPGAEATLRFTLTNASLTETAQSIEFADVLSEVLPGLRADEWDVADVCGSGSQIAGSDTLQLTGGTLAPDTSCSFEVPVDVPLDATMGEYANRLQDAVALYETGVVISETSAGPLAIADPLLLSAQFEEGVGAPGGTATLLVRLANVHPFAVLSEAALSVDLEAAAPGLVATGLPTADVCGVGSALEGTDPVVLTNGTLEAGASCTLRIPLALPSPLPLATELRVRTSALDALLDGTAIQLAAAEASLPLALVAFTKALSGDVVPGAAASVRYRIEALDASVELSDLRFSDPLESLLPGLRPVESEILAPCGDDSTLLGGESLRFTGGRVAGGGLCEFTVSLRVPSDAAPGAYESISSPLLAGGVEVSAGARAELVVIAPPMEPLDDLDMGDAGGRDAGAPDAPDAGRDSSSDGGGDTARDQTEDDGAQPGDLREADTDADADATADPTTPGSGDAESGCGCGVGAGGSATPWGMLVAIALLLPRRRRTVR